MPTETEAPCQAVRIGPGAFWVLRPNASDDRTYAYGIVDEASKVNLNSASQDMLTRLPDMTGDLAAALVDWRDSDDVITPGGAESEYYLLLAEPYYCKNGPLETVEELFLVAGASREILFGEDVNRNGVLKTNEDDGDATEPADNRDGRLDRGLWPFVTVYSATPNTTSTGQPRININASPSQLTDLLRRTLSAERVAAVLDPIRRGRPFRNVLDFYLRSGLTASEFQAIEDQLTTTTAAVVPGLINVNTAPAEVLACLPDLDEGDVSALLAAQMGGQTDLDSLTWVAQVLPAEKASAIGGLLTTRSYQFSADLVSVAGDGRSFRRCRIVVDARGSPPKVISRQDLTQLGWPLAPEILTRLRAGESLEEIATTYTPGQEGR